MDVCHFYAVHEPWAVGGVSDSVLKWIDTITMPGGGRMLARKPPTEVTGRGRVRNPLGAEQVEIGLILAAKLQVFQTRSLAERVVRQARHVIRLVIRQINLEQVQPPVDRLRQSQHANELLHETDAAVGRAAGSARQLIPHVASPQHRPRRILGIVEFVQPLDEAALAGGDAPIYNRVHSNSFLQLPCSWNVHTKISSRRVA